VLPNPKRQRVGVLLKYRGIFIIEVSGMPLMSNSVRALVRNCRLLNRERVLLNLVLLQQPPSDDQALQLVGAAADDQQRGVAIEALHRKIFRVTVAA
jgi:hypothetical protein